MTLTITPPKEAGRSLHFHHDQVNAHPDHKHDLKKAGASFDCDVCGEYVRASKKANPDNFVGWKVEKA